MGKGYIFQSSKHPHFIVKWVGIIARMQAGSIQSFTLFLLLHLVMVPLTLVFCCRVLLGRMDCLVTPDREEKL